jgi:hypothetical protein
VRAKGNGFDQMRADDLWLGVLPSFGLAVHANQGCVWRRHCELLAVLSFLLGLWAAFSFWAWLRVHGDRQAGLWAYDQDGALQSQGAG